MDRRLHDFRAAYRTLSLAITAIAEGYRFTDENAPAKIKSLQNALGVIAQELQRAEKSEPSTKQESSP